MDPSHVIEFPDIKDKRLLDVMKVRPEMEEYVYPTLIRQCRVAFWLDFKTSPRAKFSMFPAGDHQGMTTGQKKKQS